MDAKKCTYAGAYVLIRAYISDGRFCSTADGDFDYRLRAIYVLNVVLAPSRR